MDKVLTREELLIAAADKVLKAAQRCSLDRPMSYVDYDCALREWNIIKESK